MILFQNPADNRFVMRDSLSKLSEAIKSSLHFRAGMAWKRPVQSRTPQRPVVVRLATAIDPSATTDEPDPEAQRHGCYELIRGLCARTATEDDRHAVTGVTVEASGRIRVPMAAVSSLKPGVHGISQGNLKGLQRSMKHGPQLCVSRIELQGGPVIALGGVQVGLHSLGRESPFKRM